MSEREARQSWALQAPLQASVVPGGLNPGTTLPSGQLRCAGLGLRKQRCEAYGFMILH